MRTVLQHPNLSRLYHRINPLSSTVVEALLPKTRATLNSKKVITEDPDSGIFFTDQVVPALDSILQENTELSQVFACLKTSSHFLEVVEKIRA